MSSRRWYTCKKSDTSIAAELAEYAAAEPTKDPTTERVWTVSGKPVAPTPPSGNTVQCCTQMFNDITADSVSFGSVTQKCSQNISETISTLSATEAAAAVNAGVSTTAAPVDAAASAWSDYSVWIIIAVIILLLSCSSSIVMILFTGSRATVAAV